MPRVVVICLAAGVSVLAAGCGTSDDRDQARSAVERFYEAVRHDDGDQACRELGESTVEELESQEKKPCASAITEVEYEGGAVVSTEVYVTNAKVDLRSGESAFLSREPSGWKLTAVACQVKEGKPADRPLDCDVEA